MLDLGVVEPLSSLLLDAIYHGVICVAGCSEEAGFASVHS